MFLLFFQEGGGLLSYVILFAPLFLIMYFLLIRPQNQERQRQQELVTNLKAGDEVVTNGGIIGKIKEVRESSFIIQSAEKSFLEIGKSAVVGKREDEAKK
ncbi:MAG: preprotein translocase subunit YajC [Pyrinomonadaceae bacterium]|nr:preprotein translocase subunit YajC [Pyrinomonadaceae bacterium]